MEQQNIMELTPDRLLEKTVELRDSGYRLVAVTCTNKDGYELTYSFDKELDFINLRLLADDNSEIESISGIYPYAFLYENEIRDLFGVKLLNLSVDFEGKLYRIKKQTPFGTPKSESEEVTK